MAHGLAKLGAESGGQIVHLSFSDVVTCLVVLIIGVVVLCELLKK